jgi:osmotically-inducible protein OsmY
MGERYGENARNQDEGIEYIDRYSQPDYTAVNANPGPNHLSDEELFDEINRRLSLHEGIDLTEISLQIQDGVVTLKGTVDSQRTRQIIQDITSRLGSLREIHNEILVEEGQE